MQDLIARHRRQREAMADMALGACAAIVVASVGWTYLHAEVIVSAWMELAAYWGGV